MNSKIFNARDYLETYYSSLTNENKNLMEFLHTIFKHLDSGEKLLDIGSGPTIYQLISASRNTEEIYCSDYSESARKELKAWVNNRQEAFNWNDYFEYQLELESRRVSKTNLEELKNALRSKITRIYHCDILKNPVIQRKGMKYDVVLSFFCAESITTDHTEFKTVIKNTVEFVEQDGYLIMGLLKNADYWFSGQRKYESHSINKRDIKTIIRNLGGEIKTIKSFKTHDVGDMEGHILLSARFSRRP